MVYFIFQRRGQWSVDICRKNESCKQATSPHPTKKYLSAPTKGLGMRPESCRLQGIAGFTTVTSIQILSLRHNRTTTKNMMEAQAKSRLAGIQRRVRAALIRIRRSTTKKERFPADARRDHPSWTNGKGRPRLCQELETGTGWGRRDGNSDK